MTIYKSDGEVPKVSVCIVSYNQEKFIDQCLRSVVEQVTDFVFEIIVSDDGSSDGTSNKIKRWARDYPELIKPIYRLRNIGPGENIRSVYQMATGDYLAHLDGDDYMLPGKLQKQVNLLDSMPGIIFCTHEMLRAKNDTLISSKSRVKMGEYAISDLYRNLPFFAHSSKMFRRSESPDWYSFITNATIDFEVHIRHSYLGGIYHIDEDLGVYTEGVGISFYGGRLNVALPNATRRVFGEAIDRGVPGINQSELITIYAKKMLGYAYHSARLGNAHDVKLYAKESIGIKLYSPLQLLIYFSGFTGKFVRVLARLKG